jgi:hypothetical protein
MMYHLVHTNVSEDPAASIFKRGVIFSVGYFITLSTVDYVACKEDG